MKAKAQTDAYKVSATFTLHNKPVNALWQWSQVPQVEVTAYAMLPSTSVIKFTLGMRRSGVVPLPSAHRSRNKACMWAASSRAYLFMTLSLARGTVPNPVS